MTPCVPRAKIKEIKKRGVLLHQQYASFYAGAARTGINRILGVKGETLACSHRSPRATAVSVTRAQIAC